MRQIVFFVRHTNDLDHISPVVSSLRHYHGNNFVLRVVLSRLRPNEVLASQSTKSDPRLLYLSRKGIELEYPARPRFLLSLLFRCFHVTHKRSNLFNAYVVFRPIIIVLYKALHLAYLGSQPDRYCLNIVESMPINSIIVMDHSGSNLYRRMAKLAENRKITTVSLPHGLTMFNASFTPEENNNDSAHSVEHNCSIYDYVIVPNEFHRRQYITEGLENARMVTLGSARFCNEWMQTVQELYPNPFAANKSKLRVLFLFEKYGVTYDGIRPQETDIGQQISTISLLNQDPDIELMVKINTRGITNDQSEKLSKLKIPLIDQDYATPTLISCSDVIICGGGTSVIVDAIVRGKTVVVLTYFHPVKLAYHDYNIPWIVKSEKELKTEVLPLLKNDRCFQPYDQDQVDKFLSDFVDSRNTNNYQPVLKRYAEFFENL